MAQPRIDPRVLEKYKVKVTVDPRYIAKPEDIKKRKSSWSNLSADKILKPPEPKKKPVKQVSSSSSSSSSDSSSSSSEDERERQLKKKRKANKILRSEVDMNVLNRIKIPKKVKSDSDTTTSEPKSDIPKPITTPKPKPTPPKPITTPTPPKPIAQPIVKPSPPTTAKPITKQATTPPTKTPPKPGSVPTKAATPMAKPTTNDSFSSHTQAMLAKLKGHNEQILAKIDREQKQAIEKAKKALERKKAAAGNKKETSDEESEEKKKKSKKKDDKEPKEPKVAKVKAPPSKLGKLKQQFKKTHTASPYDATIPIGVLMPPSAEFMNNKKENGHAVKEQAKPKKKKEREPSPHYEDEYEEEEDDYVAPVRSRRPQRIVEDEGNEEFYENNFSSLIQNMFRRGRGRDLEYDDVDDMEAGFDDIENEEDFSHQVGEYEDLREEEEERKRELKRKGQWKEDKTKSLPPPPKRQSAPEQRPAPPKKKSAPPPSAHELLAMRSQSKPKQALKPLDNIF